MPACKLSLIKGFLIDKNPPAEITTAIDELLAEKKTPADIVTLTQDLSPKHSAPLTLAASNTPTPYIAPPPADKTPTEESAPAATAAKKPRRQWSEEARAAQKKRMQEKLATGWRPGQKNPPADTPGQDTPDDGGNAVAPRKSRGAM